MANADENGRIVWWDLTVPDAEAVRDFYGEVVGWSWKPHSMGGYDDYDIQLPGSEETVTGICHRRGANADIPSAWLPYVRIADVDAAARRAAAKGGRILAGPRAMGAGRFAVIQDPAGAKLALFGPEPGVS
jgi:hypothetical protein